MFANGDVVSYLHKVINLDFRGDSRNTKRSTIDSGIGADFYVIANFDGADLRKFPMAAVTENVAESVTSNHSAGMHLDPGSQFRTGIKSDARMQPTFFADGASASEKTESFNDTVFTDFNFIFNHYVGADEDVWFYPCAGSHDRGWMNSRWRRVIR